MFSIYTSPDFFVTQNLFYASVSKDSGPIISMWAYCFNGVHLAVFLSVHLSVCSKLNVKT